MKPLGVEGGPDLKRKRAQILELLEARNFLNLLALTPIIDLSKALGFYCTGS